MAQSAISKSTTSGYGSTWSTNPSLASSSSTVITSTGNRWTPTLYPLETEYGTTNTTDPSKGYSDAKITKYNLSNNNSSAYYNGDSSKANLSDDKRSSYSAEKRYPSMTVVYNALWGTAANRNTAVALKTSNGTGYWLSSRCVGAGWRSAGFRLRCVSGSGSLNPGYVFSSDPYVYSACFGLRPVLVVKK